MDSDSTPSSHSEIARSSSEGDETQRPSRASRHVDGTLRISRIGDAGREELEATEHRTRFVPDGFYRGMADNDIRGFLDGSFVYGWNQAEQQHVRVGRTKWHRPAPRYGEPELFRCLQRWSDLPLPRHAEVIRAELSLSVERAPVSAVRVFLYPVRRDWGPGRGGELGDNTSPPRKGEVWWREAAAGEREWGLPGASFASEEHEDPDIGVMPLAEAMCCSQDDSSLAFHSERLTRYVDSCLTEGRPCLFMLKLDSDAEDDPGSLIELYSAEHGESRSPARRPELLVDWECGASWTAVHDLHLEGGQEITLEDVDCRPGDWFAATFSPRGSSEFPRIEIREEIEGRSTDWREARYPFRARGDRVSLRVRAVRNPIAFGESFVGTVRDTWVSSGPPESRNVTWTFWSPTGAEHALDASFLGDYEWRVRFRPDEVGRWLYTWKHDFTSDPYDPVIGEFDVVANGRSRLLEELRLLRDEISSGVEGERYHAERRRLCLRFMNLLRATMSSMSPEDWRGVEGEEVRSTARDIRSHLWGKQVPSDPPMEAHPRTWKAGQREGSDDIATTRRRLFPHIVRKLRRIARRIVEVLLR